jgi:putative peptide zinc metalloprotease protein
MMTQQLMAGFRPNLRGETRHRVVALRAVAAVAAFAAGLAWVWGPDGGTHRPDDSAPGAVLVSAPGAVPIPASHAAPALRVAPASWEHPARAWAFPFDPPAAPAGDGNQALAVNTTDGTVTYSAEFGLVWADAGDPMPARNEAYAFANCAGCTAVAVGFQVVLIVEQPNALAPENHSAAVNYNCLECHTQALASQLVLTVNRSLSDDGMEQLSALWDEIDEYGRNLQDVPPSDIQPQLEAYKARITAIVHADPAATEESNATSTETCDGESTSPATPAPEQGA